MSRLIGIAPVDFVPNYDVLANLLNYHYGPMEFAPGAYAAWDSESARSRSSEPKIISVGTSGESVVVEFDIEINGSTFTLTEAFFEIVGGDAHDLKLMLEEVFSQIPTIAARSFV